MPPSYHPFAQTTPGGYNFGQCVSALQKEIRRSNEWNAMYWAMQIEATPKMSGYLWKRLAVIASEDIGIDGGNLPLLLATLRASYEETKPKGGEEHRLFLGHAIQAMCRSPKSRSTCNFVVAEYYGEHRLEIPDYALDRHTLKGKQQGRSWEHFFEEAARIEPPPGEETLRAADDHYEAECERLIYAGANDRFSSERRLPGLD